MMLTASRVTTAAARTAFANGETIVVSERGHQSEISVSSSTVTHDKERISWDELSGMVEDWRGRYPGQRYYVVTENSLVTCDTCPAVSETGWGDTGSCLDCSPASEICAEHNRTFEDFCPLCDCNPNACTDCDNPQALYRITTGTASQLYGMTTGRVTRHYCGICYLRQP